MTNIFADTSFYEDVATHFLHTDDRSIWQGVQKSRNAKGAALCTSSTRPTVTAAQKQFTSGQKSLGKCQLNEDLLLFPI